MTARHSAGRDARSPAPADDGGRRTGAPASLTWLLLAATLAAGAALRAHVISSIPHFFGPGDPGIYYQMARGCLHHGVPRVDFLHLFLSLPPAITHLEDFYEPLFGYLLALPMALAGEQPRVAALVPLAFGVLTILLVWLFARRHGAGVAVTAAAIVAFEPWSIYYSGVIMKETAVAVAALLFLEALRRVLAGAGAPARAGARLGLVWMAAGLVQYELLPILGLTALIALAAHRRPAIPAFLATAGTLGLILLGVTWRTLGVPVSAKYLYFLGRDATTPEPAARAVTLAATVRRWLPGTYATWTVLTSWYPLLAVLAGLGLAGARARTERTITAAFTLVFLWLHAVPGDLWNRDYIPLTAVLAVPAARALHAASGWRARPWAPALTGGCLGFLFLAPPLLPLARRGVPALAGAGFWPPVLAGLGVGLAVAGLLWIARPWLSARRLRFVLPAALAAGLALSYWVQLPYPAIYQNAQFPDYEIVRARRERVCAWMKATVPAAPVMAKEPEEVALYSGFPAVPVPQGTPPGPIVRYAARYGVRYLLIEPGAMADSLVRALPADELGEREGVRLFRFRLPAAGSGGGAAAAHRV
jgi:hypothetical protein